MWLIQAIGGIVNLKPINGNVLIELLNTYEYASTPEQQYATKTSGYVRAMPHELSGSDDPGMINARTERIRVVFSPKSLLNKRVWFASYQDDSKIEDDGKVYTFIKYEDIKGVNDVEAE